MYFVWKYSFPAGKSIFLNAILLAQNKTSDVWRPLEWLIERFSSFWQCKKNGKNINLKDENVRWRFPVSAQLQIKADVPHTTWFECLQQIWKQKTKQKRPLKISKGRSGFCQVLPRSLNVWWFSSLWLLFSLGQCIFFCSLVRPQC